ncbi:Cytochrome P450 76C3 [Triticum urartu]|uniref:Cytochrome P450 76C3 n=1 Tax=Triticum urartu TaxID=4572 RepID=M8A2L8_TRIUA|nr:Cytochrome P450 76C3 [Triticum urartu]
MAATHQRLMRGIMEAQEARRSAALAEMEMGAAVDASRGVFTTALNLLSCTIFSADIIDLDDREGTGQFRAMIASFTEVVGLPNLSDFFHVLVKIRFESLTDKSKFDTQPKLFIHLALVPDTLNHRQRRRHDQVRFVMV